jgi:hypothetical protein
MITEPTLVTYRLPVPGYIAQPGAPTRWLTTFIHVPEQEIIGCTEKEVAEIEAEAGRPLPLSYKQWLREAGRGIGNGGVADHFRRSYLMYPDVLKVREMAKEALRGWGDESLLGRAFPFYNWEFWCTYLLDLSELWEDPPVLQLDADSQRVDRLFPSFSCFMAYEIFKLADGLEMSRRR